ncbi:MAG: hypothetical protein M1504_03935 [Candidatus Marsarchaeota archaeon]|nr:hypothetical protein [Candidatus Marsarchaeota archaeon]
MPNKFSVTRKLSRGSLDTHDGGQQVRERTIEEAYRGMSLGHICHIAQSTPYIKQQLALATDPRPIVRAKLKLNPSLRPEAKLALEQYEKEHAVKHRTL